MKCGSAIDAFGSCKACGRLWSDTLTESEVAVDHEGKPLEAGKHYDAIVYPVKATTKKSKYIKNDPDAVVPFSEDLPLSFKLWEIKRHDDEGEIFRKRSLMRLDSRRIYNQMGLAVRAHETQKATLLWISGLMEVLDKEEQLALAPFVERLKTVFDVLTLVRKSKIVQAARMEKKMEEAYHHARRARVALAAALSKRAKLPAQDSEGLGLGPVALDPSLLLEQAKEKLLALEKSKGERKRKPVKSENPFEESDF